MATSNKLISVVTPAYDERESLPELAQRLKAALSKTGHDFEILIVENGSRDDSCKIIRGLHREDPRVRYIKLSRNFGHQGALVAGLEHCRGDCAVTIDADLQQPPEMIPEMIRLWEEGFDVVYTTKEDAGEIGRLKKMGMSLFYRILSFAAHLKLSYGQSDFRLVDRKIINVLKNIPEREKFLRGLVFWMGYRQTGLSYRVERRHGGESKFSLVNLVKFAVNGIFAFSIFPLRIYLYAGVLISGLCLLYGTAISALKLLEVLFPSLGNLVLLPPGWATVVYLISFLGGFQLIGIGLLGEYVGKTLKQVKGRPVYIIEESSEDADDHHRGSVRRAGTPHPAAHR